MLPLTGKEIKATLSFSSITLSPYFYFELGAQRAKILEILLGQTAPVVSPPPFDKSSSP